MDLQVARCNVIIIRYIDLVEREKRDLKKIEKRYIECLSIIV